VKVVFAVAPYFRVLRSYNPRISLMLQTLVEQVAPYHDTWLLNGDAGSGALADWMSIALSWSRMEGPEAANEVARFVDDLWEQQPDVVVFGLGDLYLPTVELHSAPLTLRAVRALRARGFLGRVVGVGTWPTLFGEAYNWPGFDAWVAGRCEANIRDILEGGARGLLRGQSLDAEHLPTIRRGRVIPEPDYANDYDYILSSVGCVARCAFCPSPMVTGGYSAMSPARFVDAIEERIAVCGAKRLYFADMTFTRAAGRARSILHEMQRRHVTIPWCCESTVDVPDALLAEMATSGCTHVKVGVEFLSDPALQTMNKGQTVLAARDAVRRIQAAGLGVVVYCMLGAPSTTEEDYWRALPLWEALEASYYVVNISCPYYGTPLYFRMATELMAHGWATPDRNLWLSHVNTDVLPLWGLGLDVLKAYLQLSRRTTKEDSGCRTYEAKD